MNWRQLIVLTGLLLLLFLSGCAGEGVDAGPPRSGSPGTEIHGFSADRAIQDEWWHVKFRGETEYRLVAANGTVAIRAVGRESASALYRRVSVTPLQCPLLEWSWRVEQLQPNADLTIRNGDDVAASVFVLFGDPGLLSNPDPVPTIRYVWTNKRAEPGMIFDNPYLPGTVRNIVVRAGLEGSQGFLIERRNLVEDFVAAFGPLPIPEVAAIAIMSDNDQTMEPVVSYYEYAQFLCN